MSREDVVHRLDKGLNPEYERERGVVDNGIWLYYKSLPSNLLVLYSPLRKQSQWRNLPSSKICYYF